MTIYLKYILVLATLLFSQSSNGQMNVIFILPDSTGGELSIYNMISRDSLDLIYYKKYFTDTVIANIQISNQILMKDPVLKYTLENESSSFESHFVGNRDSIVVSLSTNATELPKNNKFYKLSVLSNNFDGSEQHKDAILGELECLFKNNPNSEYTAFIIYSALANGLIDKGEFTKHFNLHTNKSDWNNYIAEALDPKPVLPSHFIDTITLYSLENEIIMLKFWASWCKPCLIDDQKIDSMKKEGASLPFIIGIENDKAPFKTEMDYLNFLDIDKSITRYYNINIFPSYILLKNNEIIFHSTSLNEVIAFYQEKK